MRTPQPWAHRKTAPIEIVRYLGRIVYYRKDGRLVTELCLGERYAHIAPGWVFHDELYRGSSSDNWHGGPSGSLHDLLKWVLQAERPDLGPSLWMVNQAKLTINLPHE
jgi:hypothetical protein